MQQTLKAKVTNLLEEKLEAQDASDESNDMNESEHSDELFDFLLKTRINTRVLEPELPELELTFKFRWSWSNVNVG